MAGFGMIGFYDDLLKVTKQTQKGFSGRRRLGLEVAIAIIACFAMMELGTAHTTGLALPAINGFVADLGVFFLPLGFLGIVSAGIPFILTEASTASRSCR